MNKTSIFGFAYKQNAGQVLLLIALLITSLLTVVMALSFRASRDTQLTIAQVETSRLDSIVEMAAEQAIVRYNQNPQTGTITYNDLFDGMEQSVDLSGVNSLASYVRIEQFRPTGFFEIPALTKDEQYLLYLSEYGVNEDGEVQFDNPYNGDIDMKVEVVDGKRGITCRDIVIELSIIHGNPGSYEVTRFIVDNNDGANSFDISQGGLKRFDIIRSDPSPSNPYVCDVDIKEAELNRIGRKRILIARVMYDDPDISEVTITFIPENSQNSLPPQGVEFRSVVFSGGIQEPSATVSPAAPAAPGGMKKEVTVFQSYPQIPADLFVTQF